MARPSTPAGLDAAEVYRALGPLTRADRQHLAGMTRVQQLRWFANIYGQVGAPYARAQYQATRRRDNPGGHRDPV